MHKKELGDRNQTKEQIRELFLETPKENGSLKPFFYKILQTVKEIEEIEEPPAHAQLFSNRLKAEVVEDFLERAVKSMNLQISTDEKAHYCVYSDTVYLPEKPMFFAEERFYETTLYELVHAAGHQKRLNLNGSSVDVLSKAKEELRTELASCFLFYRLGLKQPSQDNKHEHVDNWIRIVQEEEQELFFAFLDARTIADYLSLQGELKPVLEYHSQKGKIAIESTFDVEEQEHGFLSDKGQALYRLSSIAKDGTLISRPAYFASRTSCKQQISNTKSKELIPYVELVKRAENLRKTIEGVNKEKKKIEQNEKKEVSIKKILGREPKVTILQIEGTCSTTQLNLLCERTKLKEGMSYSLLWADRQLAALDHILQKKNETKKEPRLFVTYRLDYLQEAEKKSLTGTVEAGSGNGGLVTDMKKSARILLRNSVGKKKDEYERILKEMVPAMQAYIQLETRRQKSSARTV